MTTQLHDEDRPDARPAEPHTVKWLSVGVCGGAVVGVARL